MVAIVKTARTPSSSWASSPIPQHQQPTMATFFGLSLALSVLMLASCATAIVRRSWDDPNERAMLTRMYNECGGPAWTRQENWLNESLSMCQWRGVMGCSFALKQGFIPTLSLRVLDFSQNNLRCAFPQSLLNLPYLLCLILSHNRLSGSVADASFSSLTVLQHLDLSHNLLEGSVPPTLLDPLRIETIDLSWNRFSGSISPDSKWNSLVLTNLILDNNRLNGTIPLSLGKQTKLRVLSIRNNILEGSIPSFLGELENLRHLDLSQNSLLGSIPNSFGTVQNSSLSFLNISHNFLNGEIPRMRSINLLFIDVSHNRLVGEFDLLSESFGPASIDVSHNLLSGRVLPYQFVPGTVNRTYFVDISGNSFPCPLPMFDASILMRRSPCIPPWNVYSNYILIAIGIVSAVGFIGWLIHRRCCQSSELANEASSSYSNLLPRVIWWASWAVFSLFSAADFFGLWNIMVYLGQSFDNCARFNGYQLFAVRMPPVVYFSMFSYSEILPQEFMKLFAQDNGPFDTFSQWISFLDAVARAPPVEVFVTANFTAIKEDTASSFSSQCAAISGCAYSPATQSCILADANAVEFGGTAFETCLALAIAVMALLAVGELLRLVVVARSCCVASVRWHPRCADFVFSSTYAPLLRFGIGASRFESDIVLHQSTARDMMWRIVHQALLRSIPVVALNYYFLTRIAQTGLAWTNAISLLNGLISVPLLLVRAFFRFRAAMAAAAADHLSLEASLDLDSGSSAESENSPTTRMSGHAGVRARVSDGDGAHEHEEAPQPAPELESETKSSADVFDIQLQLVTLPRSDAIDGFEHDRMPSIDSSL